LWHESKHNFDCYEELVNKIKFTAREWKLQKDRIALLKNISWIFHLDITIIGFCHRRVLCTCKHHFSKMCVQPYYIFQNPLLKILKQQNAQMSIIIHNDNFYLNSGDCLKPFLLNKLPNDPSTVTFNNFAISSTVIVDIILKNKVLPLCIPFNVHIYSTYTYTNVTSVKHITKHLIGQYLNNDSSDHLHLFITPHLSNLNLYVNVLMNIKNPLIYDKKTLIGSSIFHFTEMNKIYTRKKKQEEHQNKTVLNQEHCICDHSSTTAVFLSKPTKMFKPLGKLNFLLLYIIKYNKNTFCSVNRFQCSKYLQENLGKLGNKLVCLSVFVCFCLSVCHTETD